jgi:oligoribonuclease
VFKKMTEASNLIWIDLEMTGLDPDFDRIIEIATVVTDPQLNVIAEGAVFVIHQSEHLLSVLDEWNIAHHGSSGLLDKVRSSTVTAVEAEQQTLAFLQRHVAAGQSPMCGNSIGLDRRFLYRYMPSLERFFHYRSIDVSTIKELARCWAPTMLANVDKQSSHRAINDIHDSIEELRYYRQHFFKC